MRLRNRQQRFVDEYLIDLNATRAAIAAGYSKRTAAQAGWEVLRNPKVAAELARRQEAYATSLEVTLERVLRELAALAFSNPADYFVTEEAGNVTFDATVLKDRSKAAAISQLEVRDDGKGGRLIKVRFADKRAALVDLGNHLGLFDPETRPVEQKREFTEEELDPEKLARAMLLLLNKGVVAREAREARESEALSAGAGRVIDAMPRSPPVQKQLNEISFVD